MKQIIIVFSVLIALASCTKSSTSVTDTSEILRTGKWRLKAYTLKLKSSSGQDTVIDIYAKRDTCYSDDYITFDSSYNGAQHSGSLKCAGELDEIPFKWQLKDNQKTLVLSDADFTIGNISKTSTPSTGLEYVEATITKINKKSMTINYKKDYWVFIDYRPILDTTLFADDAFYYTMTFEK